jgi:hypothetical protein
MQHVVVAENHAPVARGRLLEERAVPRLPQVHRLRVELHPPVGEVR